MESKPGRRRGRPPRTEGEPKRAAFHTRLRAGLKERLEESAAKAGRSLSEEIEFRLERSFSEDRSLGGPTAASAFRACAEIARSQSAHRGVDWLADQELFDFVLNEWTVLWRRLLRPEAKKGKVYMTDGNPPRDSVRD